MYLEVRENFMPTYDYQCEENGRIVEVRQKMNDVIKTWGEVCEINGWSLEGTSANTPVSKLATGGGCPGSCDFN